MAEPEGAFAVAAVLDASALIALLHDEPGAEAVVEAIAAGAVVSVVNWAEPCPRWPPMGTIHAR